MNASLRTLNTLNLGFNSNKLSLNVAKTQSLMIRGRKRLNDIEKVEGAKPLFNAGMKLFL